MDSVWLYWVVLVHVRFARIVFGCYFLCLVMSHYDGLCLVLFNYGVVCQVVFLCWIVLCSVELGLHSFGCVELY